MTRIKSNNSNCVQKLHVSEFDGKTKNQIKKEMIDENIEARYCGKNQTFYMYRR
ncbi:MAG: hypothetical protein H8E98_04500 [Bacteroidetes bacterium]|nr:hypothetical protein [Bacteroidota bacterium]